MHLGIPVKELRKHILLLSLRHFKHYELLNNGKHILECIDFIILRIKAQLYMKKSDQKNETFIKYSQSKSKGI